MMDLLGHNPTIVETVSDFILGGSKITAVGDCSNDLKDDAVEVLHSTCQQIWKTQQWPQTRKSQFSFQYQRKTMPKNVQTTTQLHSFHTLTKKYPKLSKLDFNSL